MENEHHARSVRGFSRETSTYYFLFVCFELITCNELCLCSRSISDAPPDLGVTGSQPFRYGGRLAYTQPNTPELSAALYRRQVMSSEALADDRRSIGSTSKHVSFDASSPNSEIYTSAVPANASKSQERLLDGRKTPEPFPEPKRLHTGAFSPVLARAILLGTVLFTQRENQSPAGIAR